MADVPTNEPLKVTAGDTISWSRTLGDYPATAGWVLSYAMRNVDGAIDITAGADGDDHLVTVAAATSAAWAAGEYTWDAYVTSGAERYKVDYGTLQVEPDLSVLTMHDGRSHVKQALDNIEAVISGRATEKQLAYSINGRSLSLTPMEELRAFRTKYLIEYRREQDAERIRNGLGSTRRILTRL